MMRRLGFALLLACLAACGKSGGAGDAPTVVLYTPEASTVARHWLAVSGIASGDLSKIEVQIDDADPVRAAGRETWSVTLDLTSIPDGAHVVRATATDSKRRTSQTLPVSFINAAHQAPDQHIVGGSVTGNSTQPIPGAAVKLFDTPAITTVADLNGHYALTGVADASSSLLVGGSSGYLDTYMPRIGGSGDELSFDIPLLKQATVDFLANGVGVTITPGTTFVLGFLIGTSGQAAAGTTVQLTPAPGAGPFYLAADGTVDPQLPSSSSSGVFFAFNVPSGGPIALSASNGSATFFTTTSEAVADSVALLYAAQQRLAP